MKSTLKDKKLGAALSASVLASAVALFASSAFAHHSFAMFDASKEVTLDGVVKEFQWTNPHSWIQLTVMENGQPVEYSIEGQSPNGWARQGWTRHSLKSGDHVKVVISPLKDGSKGGSFKRAIFPDGHVLGREAGG
jgi:hypothetical protein